jgi:excisionase family DNA binding protein
MNKPENHDRLHSVESAAEFLGGISPYTIRAWLTQGRLTRVKVGRRTRVYESELRRMIKESVRRTVIV